MDQAMTQQSTPPPEAPATTTHAPMSVQARLAVGVGVILALVALFWPRAAGDRDVPRTFALDDHGNRVQLSSIMPRVTLVHYWATWCAPCITEIPSLRDFERELANRDDFKVLYIAVADDPAKAKSFVHDTIGPLLHDSGWESAHKWGTRALPETWLVVDGRIHHRWEGAQVWSEPDVRKRVLDALAEPAA
jgi:thiol-disulfide isomerase/thioredoxin